MTAALTPEIALAYLGELTVDVRAVAVLGPNGDAVAGQVALAVRARALSAAPGVHRVAAADGTLLLARNAAGAAIAVLAGNTAVLPLLEHDLARVAEALVVPDSQS
jgi:hypothetical protein